MRLTPEEHRIGSDRVERLAQNFEAIRKMMEHSTPGMYSGRQLFGLLDERITAFEAAGDVEAAQQVLQTLLYFVGAEFGRTAKRVGAYERGFALLVSELRKGYDAAGGDDAGNS